MAGSGSDSFIFEASSLHAGAVDVISNFHASGNGAQSYLTLAQSAHASTGFMDWGGSALAYTATGGGYAYIFASGASASALAAHTNFTLPGS